VLKEVIRCILSALSKYLNKHNELTIKFLAALISTAVRGKRLEVNDIENLVIDKIGQVFSGT
jgi:hypothetical protein